MTTRPLDFGYRSITLLWDGRGVRWRLRTIVVCSALVALTLIMTIAALLLGDYPISPAQLWAVITDSPDAGFSRTVILEWRAPRALAAVIFGAALGASGAVFQSLTRNPLASPDIIGFTAGSYTGALIVIIVLHGTYLQLAGGAIIGGLVTALLVYAVSWRGGVQGFRLIIVGIAISAMLGSFNTWLMLTADLEVALSAAAWGVGSLAGTGWEQALWGSAAIAVLLVGLLVTARSLGQLELGDDAALATGVRTGAVRLTGVVLGVALIAVVTAAAGPITFIALAAPQIVRRIAATPGVTIAASAAMGGFLLSAADVVAQHALPVTLPVGVVTVVAGGSYLVWLIFREVRRRA